MSAPPHTYSPGIREEKQKEYKKGLSQKKNKKIIKEKSTIHLLSLSWQRWIQRMTHEFCAERVEAHRFVVRSDGPCLIFLLAPGQVRLSRLVYPAENMRESFFHIPEGTGKSNERVSKH